MATIAGDPARERAMRATAQAMLRGWLRDDGIDRFARIGQDAIRQASDATARLSRAGAAPSADAVLAEVEAFAAALVAPPPAPRRWWQARVEAAPAPVPTPEALATLVERIDRQRDAVTRRLIALNTDRARFVAAEEPLADAVHLLRALPAVVEAAARELRVENPARAATLADHVAAALPEREQAILTQWVVNRQAILTLDLLIANQGALGDALDRARGGTLSAIRVAAAARAASIEGTALARQSDALAAVARAAADDGDAAHAKRMLDDAVAQARAALAADR